MRPDILIVGGGTAGAVLAARLSADPRRSVMLLEGGPDFADRAAMPSDLLDSRGLGAMTYDWEYSAEAVPGRTMPYRRGKVMGGTSTINATGAMWPAAEDMAEWAERDAPLWSWECVEPIPRRIESDRDFPTPPHGNTGPLPIQRYRPEELIPFQAAFRDACLSLGVPETADHNASGLGVGPWPMNRDGMTRTGSLLGWLAPVRGRPNLTICPGRVVDRVMLKDGVATGVQLAFPHAGETISAGMVVLASGAIGTPAILCRSGIGPRADLERLGIQVILDRPGVGARVWEHAAVHVRLVPPPDACVPGRDPRFQMIARATAPDSRFAGDIALNAVTFADISASPAIRAEAGVDVVAVVAAALMKPCGHGRLRLVSRDPLVQPEIRLDLLGHAEDRRRLAAATRMAWEVAASAPLARVTQRLVRPPPDTDAALDAYVHAQVVTFNHPAGTAPFGPKDDRLSVTDQRGCVLGVTGLRIADASLMPTIPRVPLAMTCMMIGERIADLIDTPGGHA